MENKPHAFWAGLFTIGLLVVIALTVIFFSASHAERVPTRGFWLSHKYSLSSPVSGFSLPTPFTVPK